MTPAAQDFWSPSRSTRATPTPPPSTCGRSTAPVGPALRAGSAWATSPGGAAPRAGAGGGRAGALAGPKRAATARAPAPPPVAAGPARRARHRRGPPRLPTLALSGTIAARDASGTQHDPLGPARVGGAWTSSLAGGVRCQYRPAIPPSRSATWARRLFALALAAGPRLSLGHSIVDAGRAGRLGWCRMGGHVTDPTPSRPRAPRWSPARAAASASSCRPRRAMSHLRALVEAGAMIHGLEARSTATRRRASRAATCCSGWAWASIGSDEPLPAMRRRRGIPPPRADPESGGGELTVLRERSFPRDARAGPHGEHGRGGRARRRSVPPASDRLRLQIRAARRRAPGDDPVLLCACAPGARRSTAPGWRSTRSTGAGAAGAAAADVVMETSADACPCGSAEIDVMGGRELRDRDPGAALTARRESRGEIRRCRGAGGRRPAARVGHLRCQLGVLAPRAWSESGGGDPWWQADPAPDRPDRPDRPSRGEGSLPSAASPLHRRRQPGADRPGADRRSRGDRDGRDRRRLLAGRAGRGRGADRFLPPHRRHRSVRAVDLSEVARLRRGETALGRTDRRSAAADRPSRSARGERHRLGVAGRQPRARAARLAAGAHLLLAVSGGAFVSLVEPPDWAAAAAATCRNVGTYPVLAGEPHRDDLLLSAPVFSAITRGSPPGKRRPHECAHLDCWARQHLPGRRRLRRRGSASAARDPLPAGVAVSDVGVRSAAPRLRHARSSRSPAGGRRRPPRRPPGDRLSHGRNRSDGRPAAPGRRSARHEHRHRGDGGLDAGREVDRRSSSSAASPPSSENGWGSPRPPGGRCPRCSSSSARPPNAGWGARPVKRCRSTRFAKSSAEGVWFPSQDG